MKRVYKYPCPMEDRFTLTLPEYAEILCVQVQRGVPTLWALVDPGHLHVDRYFRLSGTGHPIEPSLYLRYIDTFQLQGCALVFHLFEIMNE